MEKRSRFPVLTLTGFNISQCSGCKIEQVCLEFSCGHNWCDNCYYKIYKTKIINLAKVIQSMPEKLNGKFSFIGCGELCYQSACSIPPEWLALLFENFEDEDYAKTIKECASFLSGVTSYFTRCQNCRKVHCSTLIDFQCSSSP